MKSSFGNEAIELDEEEEEEQDEYLAEQKRNKLFMEDQATSLGNN